jgi:Na+-transporting NADH:ubiquinone oxidoreductase subunit NqrF
MFKRTKFEFAIFNEQVRAAVARGEQHKHYKDDWQNQHFIEVAAANEKEATSRIRARYPQEQGFVILACREITSD